MKNMYFVNSETFRPNIITPVLTRTHGWKQGLNTHFSSNETSCRKDTHQWPSPSYPSVKDCALQRWHSDYKATQIVCPQRNSSTHSRVLLPAHIRQSTKNLFKQHYKNHVFQDQMIVSHFSQLIYKQKNQQCPSQGFGFWHWKQLFFVFHFVFIRFFLSTPDWYLQQTG